MRKKSPNKGRFLAFGRAGVSQTEPNGEASGDALEHFDAHFARCDFAKSGHAGFVFTFDARGMALAQHAGAVCGGQNKLKAVGDLFQAIFNSDAGHEFSLKIFVRGVKPSSGLGKYQAGHGAERGT